jgi:transposase-like protein
MARKRHTPEQIAAALRQLESGIPAVELCRRLGVHENTMSAWKKKYGSLARRRSASCASCATRTSASRSSSRT